MQKIIKGIYGKSINVSLIAIDVLFLDLYSHHNNEFFTCDHLLFILLISKFSIHFIYTSGNFTEIELINKEGIFKVMDTNIL